jgi:hypothetical protein
MPIICSSARNLFIWITAKFYANLTENNQILLSSKSKAPASR